MIKANLDNNIKAIKKAQSRTNFLVLGIFFLFWSVNGFFIGGNALKIFLLLFGFVLILISVSGIPKDNKFKKFSFFSLLFLFLFWIVAFLNNQLTTKTDIIVFDVICYLLLIFGYLIARNYTLFSKVDVKFILVITLITIIGVVLYMKFQAVLDLQTASSDSRSVIEDGGDTSINVIGIAYINAMVFFILYNFISTYTLNGRIKLIVLLGMISTFFLIISTQSRGALIYIVLILIIKNVFKLKSFKNIIKTILLISSVLLLTILVYDKTKESFPVLEEKIGGAFERFQVLMEFTENAKADESSYERSLKIERFYNDIENIIIIGQKEYEPYPHNQYVEIIMRWGVILGLPLIILSVFNFYKSLKILIQNTYQSSIVMLFVLLFAFAYLQSLTSMSLEMNRMFWLGLGFMIGLPSSSKMVTSG